MGEDISNSLRTIAKGAGIMVTGTIISKVIMLFYRLLVARFLGPADYGLLNLGLGVFWISVTFSHLGFGGGIQRRITNYLGKKKKEKIGNVMNSSLVLTIPWSILITSIVYFFADQIAIQFFNNSSMIPIIRIFALAVPFQILYKNCASLIKSFKQMKYIAYTDKIFKSLFTLLGSLLLIYIGFDYMGAVYAQLGAIVFSSVLIFYFAQHKVLPFLFTGNRKIKEQKWLFKYSWPLFLSGIVALAVSWTDTILLGVFDTSESVGIYNAAYPIAQLIWVAATNMNSVLFPVVSETYSKGEKEKAIDISSTALKWIFVLTFPALIMMVLFATPILRFIFGKAYITGSLALSVLGTAYFVRSLTSHAGSFIKSEERTKISFINSVIISVMNIILNIILIPYFRDLPGFGSPFGAATATAFSLAFGSLLATVEVYYFFDVNPYKANNYIPAVLSTLASAGLVYFILKLVFKTIPLWAMFPAFFAFTGLYFTLFLLFGGLSEHDLKILRAVDRKTDIDLEFMKNIFRKLKR